MTTIVNETKYVIRRNQRTGNQVAYAVDVSTPARLQWSIVTDVNNGIGLVDGLLVFANKTAAEKAIEVYQLEGSADELKNHAFNVDKLTISTAPAVDEGGVGGV